MNEIYSGIKDLDLKILSELNDQDLLNACKTNRYLSTICKNEYFWQSRYISKYRQQAAQYKNPKKSWKKHYLQTLIDLEKYRDKPLDFFKNILWDTKKGAEGSYYVVREPLGFQNILEIHPFLYANDANHANDLTKSPEWLMTIFWLFRLDLEVIALIDGEMKIVKFENATPAEILTEVSKYYKNDDYINGFIKSPFSKAYFPGITSKSSIASLIK